jgi:SNF2 family DNA or RNA helicase
MPLENVSTDEIPDTLAITAHAWQARGASQMDYLCNSDFRGGICVDEMGMGKTLLAIITAEKARKQLGGSFVLIVCPASCREQWAEEIKAAYKHVPKLTQYK